MTRTLACRLAPGLLVVLHTGLPATATAALRARLDPDDDRLQDLDVRAFQCSGSDQDLGPASWLLTIGDGHGAAEDLLLEAGATRFALIPDLEENALCGPRELATAALAVLAPDRRDPALSFLVSAPAAHRIATGPGLSARLAEVREIVRTPLPRTDIAPGAAYVLRLERVTEIDERAFWLSGWIHGRAPEQARLTAVTPEGVRVTPAAGAVSFHERTDVETTFGDSSGVPSLGFHIYLELERASHHPGGWLLELRSADGEVVEDVARNPVGHEPDHLRKDALDPVRTESPDDRVLAVQVLPALERLRSRERLEVERVTDFGPVTDAPDVSVVIAAARVDLIAHHLLGYAAEHEHDRGLELIFVVPHRIGRATERLGADLYDLYGVPFRVAKLSHDPGRAAAINQGAALARGRLLVLMRDDVFPTAPGWIEAMRGLHDSAAAIAAVGPKLVYEDGAIAHVGIVLRRGRRSRRWDPWSPLKGMAATVDGAHEPRQVQALSDACLMIATDRFRATGGLCESYLEGGQEAVDLCLSLGRDGLQVWCAADVELTYLEHSAWDPRSSPATRRFDDWLLDRRWGAHLSETCGRDEVVTEHEHVAALSRVPLSSASPADAPIEIIEIRRAPLPEWLRDAELVHPRPDGALEAYAGTYSLAIEGWAIGVEGERLRVEVRDSSGLRAATPVNIPRRDVAQRFPDTPGAQSAGFGTVVGTIGLAREFQLDVELVRDDGERGALATIRGRRRRLRSRFGPTLQPLLITTLGRTGSSWLELLLAQHPEIVSCRPFIHDARLTSYWAQVLRTLAEPASYLQVLRPELYPGNWWTGERRPGLLPLHMAETHMARWLGGASVQAAAGFCQARIEDFYHELALEEGRPRARYFAEKCWPDDFTPQIVAELYPDGREILLVRDFRDMICSILGFNAKRGTASFGREAADTDDDFIRNLRDSASQMLESWRARHQRAHLLRYEDLILEPEASLAGAFSYLGVAADEDTIRGAIAAANAELPAAQRDHRTSDSPAASIGRWKHELTPEQRALCEETFADILEAFGYEPTFSEHAAIAPVE